MGRKKIELNLELIKQMREEGKTYKEIAERFNCSDTTISKFCLESKINSKKEKVVIGQIFENSKLKVLERDKNPPFKGHESAYKCQCIVCGEIKTYRKSNIINGPGCHKCAGTKGGRGYRDWEIGQKFGFIEVLGKGEKEGYVIGKCECGVIREFRLQHLKGQHHSRTISCGCKQKSSVEKKIEDILLANNIIFQTQFKILDFSPYASFDFAILNDNGEIIRLIEFDGQQHFEGIDIFGGEEQFKIQQERDARKNQYCQEHGIDLLRIPYYDYDKIDLKFLIDS